MESNTVVSDEDPVKVLVQHEILTEPQEISTEPLEETSRNTSFSDTCSHPCTLSGLCILCEKNMDDDYGIHMTHLYKGLGYSLKTIESFRERNFKEFLGRRKLYLVLDLDHTLLHSVSRVNREENKMYKNMDSLPDTLRHSLYKVKRLKRMVKLRPFVHTFLKEASELFEMSICTMADRFYAQQMVKLLDPDEVYFTKHSNVIAHGDFPGGVRKSLDKFLGKESAVIILDDTKSVWENNKLNLIVAERYNYFVRGYTYNRQSHSVLKTDESESTGTLATALNLLRCIHAEFFDVADPNKDLEHRDVRQILSTICDPGINLCC